jgi:acetyl-CoA decarbonylase/synthase complex subunit beta
MSHDDPYYHKSTPHSHGAGTQLGPGALAILERGLDKLLHMTKELAFRPLTSTRYPLPLALAVYGETPAPTEVREHVLSRMKTDPVSVLEYALVLLELYACNQRDAADDIPNDAAFLSQVFRTKRQNGWIAVLGDEDPDTVEAAVNARWKFRFITSQDRRSRIYPLLNTVARHGFVYGRIPFGDSHALGHFIEEFAPGLLICRGQMDDLELTLSLAAMKMGVPAIVPPDYPFPLGRQMRIDTLQEMDGVLAAFPNIHRLLDLPEVRRLPDYVAPEHAKEAFEASTVWGSTQESFYILRKGIVESPGVTVIGKPSGPMSVILTAEAEPLSAFDRRYIETRAARILSMIRGVLAKTQDGRLVVALAEGTDLAPERIGETMIAAIRHEFPKICKIYVEIIYDRQRLSKLVESIRSEQDARHREIASATEENIDEFATCVGCSPFAPDHVCILTPERPPQCSRAYETVRTGAFYGYDDMSNIHHRILHARINSFGVCAKGDAIDPIAGEWSGVNEAVSRLTGGRIARVQLHSLKEAPHTGCSCFQLVMFETDKPRPGIGIMNRGYKGSAPDGRTWGDLHYALSGKQTPGMAGASPGYLMSSKFLAAHDGWKSVVWVSPRVAAIMGDRLPATVHVGGKEK